MVVTPTTRSHEPRLSEVMSHDVNVYVPGGSALHCYAKARFAHSFSIRPLPWLGERSNRVDWSWSASRLEKLQNWIRFSCLGCARPLSKQLLAPKAKAFLLIAFEGPTKDTQVRSRVWRPELLC